MPATNLDEMKDAYDEYYVLDNRLMLEWDPQRVVKLAQGSSLLELGLGHGFSTAFFPGISRVIRSSKDPVR